MKKTATSIAFALATLTSAVAMACTTCQNAFETSSYLYIYSTFPIVFWGPLALATIGSLFFLRKRYASRRGVILSMIGSVPFSILTVLLMIEFVSPLFKRAFSHQYGLVAASIFGAATAVNAGYVAISYLLGRDDRTEPDEQ